jgi:peptidoglycan/xylan/chitin deacetylase (PgdA/CDA1 family)
MYTILKRLIAAAIVLGLTSGITGCGIKIKYADEAMATPSAGSPAASPSPSEIPETPSPSESPSPEISPSPSPSPSPSVPPVTLVPYDGIVEHIFFHPVVCYPELAFDGDSKAKGIDQNMVTVSEYNMMLQSIYDNGYILVNMNDVWTEYKDESGVAKMKRSTLMIPEGKKPLIISFDDTNYYNYMFTNGFTHKLVIRDGEIWSYGLDPQGKEVYSQDLDAITILDKFVKAHPDFSLNGAKGCLCLTGYEGILGYRTMTDTHGMTAEMEAKRQSEITAVKPIVAMLKETGWYFGSHSWGHINLSSSNLATVQDDTERWLGEVGSLVGPTKLMFYPFGARPDGGDVQNTGPIFKYLQSEGFRIFASVGIESYSKIKTDISAVICDRMHPDGSTLRTQRDRYLKFYDAKLVFDSTRPDYGVNWD